jgi:hypothetical protein
VNVLEWEDLSYSKTSVHSLPAGTYIINFEYQGQIESNTFVKN